MGSAGALLSHPPPQLGGTLLRRHRISLPRLVPCTPEPLHCRHRRRHLRCSAVEEEKDSPVPQKEESPSTSLQLQDPLPSPVENGSFGGVTQEEDPSTLYNFLYPSKELLPDDKEMSIFDHLEELRERIFISVLAVGASILGCFFFSKDIIKILEAPVSVQGVRFLQLSPGEFFFTTLKVSGYCGLLIGSPIILYEIIAFVLPGLTKDERKFLGPIVLGSSVLFYLGILFSYTVLAPAALNFFVNYAEGAVESIWSIDQYFEFVLVLLFSTGLSFQMLALETIYGDNLHIFGEKSVPRSFQIHVHCEIPDGISVSAELLQGVDDYQNNRFFDTFSVQHLAPISLTCLMPPSYPSHHSPYFTLGVHWLDSVKISSLCHMLDSIWAQQPGQEVVFEWVQWLQSSTLSHLGFDDGIVIRQPDDSVTDPVDVRLVREILSVDDVVQRLNNYNEEQCQESFLHGLHVCMICFSEYKGLG